jgi:hypothetical protein
MVAAPVLSAATLAVLLGWATVVAAGCAYLADELERRRRRRVAAEIRVTEAVHGALGPIVAPTVTMHRGCSMVRMELAPAHLGRAGQLTEIARRALGEDGRRVRVVFAPGRRP